MEKKWILYGDHGSFLVKRREEAVSFWGSKLQRSNMDERIGFGRCDAFRFAGCVPTFCVRSSFFMAATVCAEASPERVLPLPMGSGCWSGL